MKGENLIMAETPSPVRFLLSKRRSQWTLITSIDDYSRTILFADFLPRFNASFTQGPTEPENAYHPLQIA